MLDERGKELTSEGMARLIAEAGDTGAASLVFCIGACTSTPALRPARCARHSLEQCTLCLCGRVVQGDLSDTLPRCAPAFVKLLLCTCGASALAVTYAAARCLRAGQGTGERDDQALGHGAQSSGTRQRLCFGGGIKFLQLSRLRQRWSCWTWRWTAGCQGRAARASLPGLDHPEGRAVPPLIITTRCKLGGGPLFGLAQRRLDRGHVTRCSRCVRVVRAPAAVCAPSLLLRAQQERLCHVPSLFPHNRQGVLRCWAAVEVTEKFGLATKLQRKLPA